LENKSERGRTAGGESRQMPASVRSLTPTSTGTFAYCRRKLLTLGHHTHPHRALVKGEFFLKKEKVSQNYGAVLHRFWHY